MNLKPFVNAQMCFKDKLQSFMCVRFRLEQLFNVLTIQCWEGVSERKTARGVNVFARCVQ